MSMAADASQVSDQNILVLLDEDCTPKKLNERVTEESASQFVVVLFEDQEHWAFLQTLIRRPFDNARKEDD